MLLKHLLDLISHASNFLSQTGSLIACFDASATPWTPQSSVLARIKKLGA